MPNTMGRISGQAIQPMTSRKISANGKSMKAVTVAEVMKSRIVSNDRRLAANEPADSGRFSSRRPSTRSMM